VVPVVPEVSLLSLGWLVTFVTLVLRILWGVRIGSDYGGNCAREYCSYSGYMPVRDMFLVGLRW
jgi:hypothetical protein